jgi:succinylglutamic semialdehyde dehydrogenase
VGRLLHQAFGGHPEKLLVLEMGGNNPLIIWDTDNLDAAAYYTIQSAYLTAGQRCVCARRLILPQGKAGDQMIAALLERIARLQVGPFDQKKPEPFMGGLISRKAAEQVIHAQNTLVSQGAHILTPCVMMDDTSSLIRPGLIDVTAVSHRPDEEIFGPLLQVIRVPDFESAITEANRTAYGLAAGILSDRCDRYEHFLNESHAGVVNWNKQTTGASALLPFGGVGLSGNHRPSAFYAADYSAYPVASMEADALVLPQILSPGL